LLTGAHPDGAGAATLIAFSGVAMGIQAATARALAPGMSTTYVTGTLTGLLSELSALGAVSGDRRRRASIVVALALGAVAGAFALSTVPALAPAIPRAVVGGVAVVAILGFAGALQIWHLYVTYALFGAASAFSVPALGAIIPELVPEEILVPGNAVQGLSRQGARIGGPVVGGLLVATAGPPAAFAFDALSFFLSAGAVALTRARPLAAEAGRSMLGEIREGIGFVFSVEWLWVTIF